MILSAVAAILLGASYAFEAKGATTARKPRIALLGDSMTWIGGDSCQNDTGWTSVLKASGVASAIDIYARSGATWTNTRDTRRNPNHYTELLHDDNVVYNQAVRLIERADTSDTTPDMIILFAGANDAWFAAKRPGIFTDTESFSYDRTSASPSDRTSLAGSIRLVSDILHERFPEAILLYVAPIQMSKTDEASIHHIADIIECTASETGWTTLRADRDIEITREQEARSPRFTYDGVHTNPEGARLLGDYIVCHLPESLTH